MSLTNISSFCKKRLASLSDIFPEITLCRIACSKTCTWDTPERCQNGRNDNIPITSTLNNMWLRVITILNWVWIVSANHHWLQEVYLYGDSTSTGKFASKQTYLWKWRMIIAVNFPRLIFEIHTPRKWAAFSFTIGKLSCSHFSGTTGRAIKKYYIHCNWLVWSLSGCHITIFVWFLFCF